MSELLEQDRVDRLEFPIEYYKQVNSVKNALQALELVTNVSSQMTIMSVVVAELETLLELCKIFERKLKDELEG